jgi:hypothetical protein
MHDGYLFTLGICGTAAASSPALAVLNGMLEALPHVKRAALLGEVLRLEGGGALHDPLLAQVAADMRDAEILLLVTPVYRSASTGDMRLPARLAELLQAAAPLAQAERWPGKHAALVAVVSDDSPTSADDATTPTVDRAIYRQAVFAPLQRFCIAAGIRIDGTAIVPAPDSPQAAVLAPAVLADVQALARRVYALARQDAPHALPRQP